MKVRNRKVAHILLAIAPALLLGSCDSAEPVTYRITTQSLPSDAGSVEPISPTIVDDGTLVNFRAIPEEDWKFLRWEGDVDGSENPAAVRVQSDLDVTAVFRRSQFHLDRRVEGGGWIFADPDEVFYEEGSQVSVWADAKEDWWLDHWQGDLSGTENPQSLTMDSDKSITAVFIFLPIAISLKIFGEGTVDLDPDKVAYAIGERVTLTARPAAGWFFKEWKGDLTGTENPITITVSEDLSVEAFFQGVVGSAPVIESVEAPNEINPPTSLIMVATVSDVDGLAEVKVYVRGPNGVESEMSDDGSSLGDEVAQDGRYAARFDVPQADPGTYEFVIYAVDETRRESDDYVVQIQVR